ncbi:MAG: response regulator [Prosthecobacter sp.]|uniref:response regulator n=1 Tax=Prosthecobacter sp. TaxID=1965333 RepID=UPI002609F316|nr:response regulator [Prosthecobacter sp.]MCF7789073.1 response regulator [Prosthecobacter sp.]
MQQANCHSNRSGKSGVILLVEDHDLYREVVRAALGKYLPDFEMLEADCVAAALPVLHSRHIDVMVVDMTLPDGSAIDLVEQSGHFIHQGVKVIVLSSHSSADMLPVLSRGDVHGYVSKEQGLKLLAETITAICGTEVPAPKALEEMTLEKAL